MSKSTIKLEKNSDKISYLTIYARLLGRTNNSLKLSQFISFCNIVALLGHQEVEQLIFNVKIIC